MKDITTRQLNFSTPFTLVSTAERRTKINSFVLYFDTFFTVSGNPVPPETQVRNVKEGEAILAELWPVGGKSAPQRRQSQSGKKDSITSFSTGPQSSPTHWKQTVFMLEHPFFVSEGISHSIVDVYRDADISKAPLSPVCSIAGSGKIIAENSMLSCITRYTEKMGLERPSSRCTRFGNRTSKSLTKTAITSKISVVNM